MLVSYIAHSLLGMGNILALPHVALPLASIMQKGLGQQVLAGGGGPTAGSSTDPFGDLTNLTSFLQTFILGLGATVFVIGVAIAGIMRMVAFGSERRIATSNMALTAAVVGLIIMLIGTGLLTVLKSVFGA